MAWVKREDLIVCQCEVQVVRIDRRHVQHWWGLTLWNGWRLLLCTLTVKLVNDSAGQCLLNEMLKKTKHVFIFCASISATGDDTKCQWWVLAVSDEVIIVLSKKAKSQISPQESFSQDGSVTFLLLQTPAPLFSHIHCVSDVQHQTALEIFSLSSPLLTGKVYPVYSSECQCTDVPGVMEGLTVLSAFPHHPSPPLQTNILDLGLHIDILSLHYRTVHLVISTAHTRTVSMFQPNHCRTSDYLLYRGYHVQTLISPVV